MNIKYLFEKFTKPSETVNMWHLTSSVVAFFVISNRTPLWVLTIFFPLPVTLSSSLDRPKIDNKSKAVFVEGLDCHVFSQQLAVSFSHIGQKNRFASSKKCLFGGRIWSHFYGEFDVNIWVNTKHTYSSLPTRANLVKSKTIADMLLRGRFMFL